MKTRDLLVVTVAALLLGGLIWAWFAAPEDGFETAPSVAMHDLNGAPVDLAALRGRPVLVTFWATTCVGCIREMPHLAELHTQYGERGLKVVGVAMAYDSDEDVRELVRLRELPYTIVHDVDERVSQAFGGVRLTPTSFLISPAGRIVQRRLGEFDMDQMRASIHNML